MARLHILLTSRRKAAVAAIASALAGYPDFRIAKKVIVNGHADPLHGVETPDLVIMHHARGHHEELMALAERSPAERLPLLICGPPDDAEAMRLAMKAGARDYLVDPIVERDLIDAIRRLEDEVRLSAGDSGGTLIAAVNGKGGAGASFLASNIAHSLAKDSDKRVVLLDCDQQFGGLARYLDVTPERGLFEALEVVDQMDEMSAEAFLTKHESGLKIMAAIPNLSTLAHDHPPDEFEALLQILLSYNDYVVADVPRRIDANSAAIFERADHILLVAQQSLGHVHDAARVLQVLTADLAIPAERIRVVVNRFSKNAPIELADLKKAMHVDSVAVIPNNYRLVSDSINVGVPIVELAASSAVANAIRDLQVNLVGGERTDKRLSLLKFSISGIMRR